MSAEDEKIVHEILERWENLVGRPLQKLAVVEEIAGDSPHISRISKAMLEIVLEFVDKSWR